MPRYFFDIDDGRRSVRDDTGLELKDRGVAREHAIDVLPDIARDELPDGDRHEFLCLVRDERDRFIFEARLALTAQWLGEAV